MSILDTHTINTLPHEVYLELLRYLPAVDRRRLRETSSQLRRVLTPEYFKYCVINEADGATIAPNEQLRPLPSLSCTLRVPEIPFDVLVNPSNYSWFPGADLRGVYFYAVQKLVRCSRLLKSPVNRRELPNIELVSVIDPYITHLYRSEHWMLLQLFDSPLYKSIVASWDTKKPIAFEIPDLPWAPNTHYPLSSHWSVRKLQIHTNMSGGELASSIDLAGFEELVLNCVTTAEYSAYLEQLPRWSALRKLTLLTRVIKIEDGVDAHMAVLPYLRELSRLLPTNKLRRIVLNYGEFPLAPREHEMQEYLHLREGEHLRESEKVIPQITDMFIEMQSCEILNRYFDFPNLSCLYLSFHWAQSFGQARPLGIMVENLTMLDLGDPEMAGESIALIVDTLRACRSLKRLRYATSPTGVSRDYEDYEDYANPFLLAVKAHYTASPAAALSTQELDKLLPALSFFSSSRATKLRAMVLDLLQAPERNLANDCENEPFFRAASYSEALLRVCEEMAGLEYLQIRASRGFYVSPALQRLVSRHSTLHQVLLTAEHRPSIGTHDASDRYFELMYDYLPTVPYRLVAYLRRDITGVSQEQGPLGTSKVSAVVDVGRRREFRDLTRDMVLARRQRVSDPVYQFSKPFDEDIIFNDDFAGWV